MNSTKDLYSCLPSLAILPEESRPKVAHQYAQLVARTQDRLGNFMPNTPEAKQVTAEMMAAATHILNQALLQAQSPDQGGRSAKLSTSPMWSEAGQALGQVAGVVIRGTAELTYSLVIGLIKALFAPKQAPTGVQLEDTYLPKPGALDSTPFYPNIQVHVNVDVKVNQ